MIDHFYLLKKKYLKKKQNDISNTNKILFDTKTPQMGVWKEKRKNKKRAC